MPSGGFIWYTITYFLGNWYAMTGYGVAFPRSSKHFNNFNKKIMDYSENGKSDQQEDHGLLGKR